MCPISCARVNRYLGVFSGNSSDFFVGIEPKFRHLSEDVAAGTVSAPIEHFSRYSARAYISYTLGGVKRILINPYDYCLKSAKSGGSGYAEAKASVVHGAEFFQKVGANNHGHGRARRPGCPTHGR